MSENIELSYVWDHTIIKILNHDIQSKRGNMIKEWVVFNKLEDFNSLLKYTDDDFTPTGNLCYINQNGGKLYRKLLKEFFNLRWYIQHLVDQYEYQYGDNEWTNPLHESNWTYRTNKQFMKYVNFTLEEMTPVQMKMNPIKPIIKVNTNEELDTEEGESTKVQEEFTTSEELTEEYSTFSDMSKQDFESDINIDHTQHQENSYTPELQIHNTYNTTMHEKIDLIHYEYITVYVYDLAICMRDPQAFCDTLKEVYKLWLKGVGPLSNHLDCRYTRHEDGTLATDPRKCVDKPMKNFGEKPN